MGDKALQSCPRPTQLAVAFLLQGLVLLAKLMRNENACNFLKFLNPAHFLPFPREIRSRSGLLKPTH